jgi:serine/threonine-protein kinase
MDLDDLKAEWAKRDQVLQQSLKLQTAFVRGMVVEKQLERLRRHHIVGLIELLFYLAFVIGFGAFLANNWGRWEFFVPALLLDIWTIAIGAITLAERMRLRKVDFSAPVLDIQKRLASLQAERARVFQWAFLTGQVLWWIPFVVVLCWGVFQVNLYRVSDFMPVFIATNIVAGLALIPVLWCASGLVGPRLAKSSIGRSVLDSVTGRDLAEARAIAARLAQFETEPS